MTFPEFWQISNHLAITFSPIRIPHVHGDGVEDGGRGRERFFVLMLSACFVYYQKINLRK